MKHFNYASQSQPDNLNGLPLFQKTTDKRLKIMQDICERKHGGNPESRAAFDAIKDKLNEAQRRVYFKIKLQGDYGASVDELALLLNTTPNAISGRVSELKRMGKIRKDGTRLTRSGCSAAVLKAI